MGEEERENNFGFDHPQRFQGAKGAFLNGLFTEWLLYLRQFRMPTSLAIQIDYGQIKGLLIQNGGLWRRDDWNYMNLISWSEPRVDKDLMFDKKKN